MERIRRAIELTEDTSAAKGAIKRGSPATAPLVPQSTFDSSPVNRAQPRTTGVELNRARLDSNRIISHNISDPRSRSYDMLRTQVLQSMNTQEWQLLAITSPTANCGKTLTAINLALSIARMPETSVMLVDLDLQRPQVANYLGLKCDQGILSTLEGRTTLQSAIVNARTGNHNLMVLPCEKPISGSSEWMGSRSMTALLEQIRRDHSSSFVIFDLPPILPSDDVISILPQIDCVVFVTAVGISTVPEIKECGKHLQSAPVVRIVLNKASDVDLTAYYY